jgi:hypothetical protein
MLLFYILQKLAQQKLHNFQRSNTKNNFRTLHYVALVSVPLQKYVHLQWYNYHEIKKYQAAKGCAIAQVVSRWLPTAAVRGSRPGPSYGILWWTKWRWGRFYLSTSVSLAKFHSTNCSKNHPHLSSGFVQ